MMPDLTPELLASLVELFDFPCSEDAADRVHPRALLDPVPAVALLESRLPRGAAAQGK